MRARSLVAAAVMVLAPVGPALADIYDEAAIEISTYAVSGATLAEVEAEMEANGPEGFWAFTTWHTTWDAACALLTTAEITLPELAPDAPLSEADQEEFHRMAEALLAHELGHVQIGLNFQADVAEAGCPAETDEMLQHWIQVERDYDAETEHGLHEGVYLAQD